MGILNKKIDMVGYIEVRNSNPNGDPDAGNMPRQDVNGFGYITDVSLKRCIRDSAALIAYEHGYTEEGYELYINKDSTSLEQKANESLIEAGGLDAIKKMELKEQKELITNAMCQRYFDVRTFGAVVTLFTKNKLPGNGQILGPVQVSFAESIAPIYPEQIAITRVSVATEKELREKSREIGKKWIVPYGIYSFSIHISAPVAEKTGFTEKDFEILLQAIRTMYENNYSSAKSNVRLKNLFVFTHNNKLGNCPFSTIENSLNVKMLQNNFGKEECSISIDKNQLPEVLKVDIF